MHRKLLLTLMAILIGWLHRAVRRTAPSPNAFLIKSGLVAALSDSLPIRRPQHLRHHML
jgi:hypothetical protein